MKKKTLSTWVKTEEQIQLNENQGNNNYKSRNPLNRKLINRKK